MKISLIHFSPLEMYPPVMNLARILEGEGFELDVYSTVNHSPGKEFRCGKSRIHRSANPAMFGGWRRLVCYALFQISTLLQLLWRRPAAIVYVEPSSSFPVYLYSFLRPRVRLFIHHHEYHSPDQFSRPGMRLIRFFHGLEKCRLFGHAAWVSHTNAKRMEMFVADCPMVPEPVCRLLPNYPPATWHKGENLAWASMAAPFRFVYAGSLSLKDTFIGEFVAWLLRQAKGSVQFDVYAYNLDAETRNFLEKVQGEMVRFFPKGVDYDDLPRVLRQYHAGVILYRAESLNYRYNETNKLFEYLMCGLDVWYSSRMEGVKPHRREHAYPRVIECDFEKMADRDWSGFLERDMSLPPAPEVPDAESACAVLVEAIRR
jgi:hypothetical protein